MTHSTSYPGADKSKWLPQFGNVTMPKISKLVLHSTESSGLPSYPNFAPQLTFDPWRLKFWQHLPLDKSASTLADPSSTAVRENRDNVLQVEIIGYADPTKPKAFHVNAMPPKAIQMLAELVVWLHKEWELPLVSVPPADWWAYPRSYGKTAVRMSGAAYDAFSGVLGHQHVSGNDHGDPGDIPIGKIILEARKLALPNPNPPKPDPVVPKPAPFKSIAGATPSVGFELQRVMDTPHATGLQDYKPFGDGWILGASGDLKVSGFAGLESSIYHRFDEDRKYVDTMVCRGAGHNSAFSTSGPYVWMAWDQVVKGKVTGRRIARVPYRAGTVLDSDKGIRFYNPFSASQYCHPSLDLDHNRIAIRDGGQFHVHDLKAFKKGVNKPLYTVRLATPGPFQGFATYGDGLWALSGATDTTIRLTEVRWSTGKQTAQLNLTKTLRAVGATSYEPEGIWVSRAPHPVLSIGARFGSATKRRFISYKITAL